MEALRAKFAILHSVSLWVCVFLCPMCVENGSTKTLPLKDKRSRFELISMVLAGLGAFSDIAAIASFKCVLSSCHACHTTVRRVGQRCKHCCSRSATKVNKRRGSFLPVEWPAARLSVHSMRQKPFKRRRIPSPWAEGPTNESSFSRARSLFCLWKWLKASLPLSVFEGGMACGLCRLIHFYNFRKRTGEIPRRKCGKELNDFCPGFQLTLQISVCPRPMRTSLMSAHSCVPFNSEACFWREKVETKFQQSIRSPVVDFYFVDSCDERSWELWEQTRKLTERKTQREALEGLFVDQVRSGLHPTTRTSASTSSYAGVSGQIRLWRG